MMRAAISLVLLFGLLVNVCAYSDNAKVTQSRWIIILTIIDRTTGTQLERIELDPRLEFDDPTQCESILARVGPIPSGENFSAVLTCRKTERI
jgi:hypothetical protein